MSLMWFCPRFCKYSMDGHTPIKGPAGPELNCFSSRRAKEHITSLQLAFYMVMNVHVMAVDEIIQPGYPKDKFMPH